MRYSASWAEGDIDVNVVTGAFGYTGRYIAKRLLSLGKEVRTLTGHPGRPDPFGGRVAALPLDFDNPSKLVKGLEGASTLYNTYWVRFPYGNMTYDIAVENTKRLIAAAVEAGVKRIVHISIANAAASNLPYYRGKTLLEDYIRRSGLSYAIIGPTVLFGHEDILINNIAWMLRRFPVFAIPGSGEYRIQPVFVEDVAETAVGAGAMKENVETDAAGPEVYTYNGLVRLIADNVGSRASIVHLPSFLVLSSSSLIGMMEDDVVLTRDEIEGLMAGLLASRRPAAGHTRLSEWLEMNKDTEGVEYRSELKRHFR